MVYLMRAVLFAGAVAILGASGCKSSAPVDTSYQGGEQQLTRTLHVGGRDMYKVRVHESVGFNATFASSDPAVVRIVDTTKRYLRGGTIQPGGDEAEKTVIFEAVAPGEATVRVDKNYRGEAKGTVEIKVTVVK